MLSIALRGRRVRLCGGRRGGACASCGAAVAADGGAAEGAERVPVWAKGRLQGLRRCDVLLPFANENEAKRRA
jgi:hypothetical protein